MRAFFVLVIFFLAFLLLVNSSMAEVDLTPNTPASAAAAASAPSGAAEAASPEVIYIQDSAVPSQGAVVLPVTGGCSDPYTVCTPAS